MHDETEEPIQQCIYPGIVPVYTLRYAADSSSRSNDRLPTMDNDRMRMELMVCGGNEIL